MMYNKKAVICYRTLINDHILFKTVFGISNLDWSGETIPPVYNLLGFDINQISYNFIVPRCGNYPDLS